MLLLCSCASKTYTPVLETEFQKNAEFRTGRFSYTCRIVRKNSAVSITATSSYAKGTTIKCNGKTVTYIRKNVKKRFEREIIDSTNPAVLLYEVFEYLEGQKTLSPKITDDGFLYEGKTSLGAFTLIQDRENRIVSITVPDADIEIIFS